jgi:murein L,D-transpeptidase YafK
MKWVHLLVLGLGLLAVSILPAADVPSSRRSREVVVRVQPALEKALAEKELKLGSPVFIRIYKDPAVLEVWLQKESKFDLFRSYPVCAFSGQLGPKLREGDGQAPEGCYFVTPGRMNPNSRFHLSFDLGFPNAYDRHHGWTGSHLMVHGNCVSIGCYALGDPAIEEVWTLCQAALKGGQPFFRVHCFPFPLTKEKLEKHRASPWHSFWVNLSEAFRYFEEHQVPPNVVVEGGNYKVTKVDSTTRR